MKTGGFSAGIGIFKQFSGTLNIYTWIGILTLVGLVSKHGILIVEFANQLRAQGKSITESVTEAASIRLRPILMTTAAIVLGATPYLRRRRRRHQPQRNRSSDYRRYVVRHTNVTFRRAHFLHPISTL